MDNSVPSASSTTGSMNAMPGVSVVIPAWNRADLVERAMRSVVEQDYAGLIQLIVVDDGSTDETADVVERYAATVTDPNRPVITLRRPHAGVSATVRAGLDRATSPYWMLLGSDDYWLPERVRELVEFENSVGGEALIFTNVRREDINGNELPPDYFLSQPRFDVPSLCVWSHENQGRFGKLWLDYRRPMGSGTSLIPSNLLQGEWAVPNGIPEEDYWISLVAFLRSDIYFLNSPTLVVTAHEGSLVRTRALKGQTPEEVAEELNFVERAIELLRRRAPHEGYLISFLRQHRDLRIARLRRDEGRVLSSLSATAVSLPLALHGRQHFKRWLLTLAYVAFPSAYKAASAGRYRSRYLKGQEGSE